MKPKEDDLFGHPLADFISIRKIPYIKFTNTAGINPNRIIRTAARII
jgi:hypothetical protein